MKANFKYSFLAITLALFTMISNTACTKSSSDDGGGGGGAAQSTLALQSASVATGATINLIPTGGVTPYQFTIQSNGAVTGTVTSYQTYATFLAGNTPGLVGVTVTDAAGATVQASITITSSAGGMVVSPLTFTVAPGGTVIYSVTGGTAPYTYVASAGTFSGATWTAPATAQTVTVTISDSAAHTVTATVTVSSGSTSTTGCGGTYSLNLSGFPGTLYIVQNTAGQISGYLTLTGYGGPAAISGTCNNTNGTINFTDLYSNDPYTGQFFPNPNTGKIVMFGTFSDSGATYQWSAQQQ